MSSTCPLLKSLAPTSGLPPCTATFSVDRPWTRQPPFRGTPPPPPPPSYLKNQANKSFGTYFHVSVGIQFHKNRVRCLLRILKRHLFFVFEGPRARRSYEARCVRRYRKRNFREGRRKNDGGGQIGKESGGEGGRRGEKEEGGGGVFSFTLFFLEGGVCGKGEKKVGSEQKMACREGREGDRISFSPFR